jgi:hypothetical protein
MLFTRPLFRPRGAGLRLEIASEIDKKKSELYFSFSVKKILTEKPKRACPQATKFLSAARQAIP